MPGFLRRFSFDQLSFWIGFLTGILFIWFFGKVRPLLNQLWAAFQSFTAQTRHSLSAGTESRYLADVLQLAILERAEITLQGSRFLMQVLQFLRIADFTTVQSRLGLFNFGTLRLDLLLSHLECFSGFLKPFLHQLSLFLGSSNGSVLGKRNFDFVQA